jgi:hypothetical protein
MGVTSRARMHVHVKEQRRLEVTYRQSGFLVGLTHRRPRRTLAEINMPTWLDPNPQSLVSVQDHSALGHDKG